MRIAIRLPDTTTTNYGVAPPVISPVNILVVLLIAYGVCVAISLVIIGLPYLIIRLMRHSLPSKKGVLIFIGSVLLTALILNIALLFLLGIIPLH